MPNNTLQPSESKDIWVPKPKGGNKLDIKNALYNRDNTVYKAVELATALEVPVIEPPVTPAFMNPYENPAKVVEQRTQQAFAPQEQAVPQRQEYTAQQPAVRPDLYVEPATVPAGTPNMLNESEDDMSVEARRRAIFAIHDEIQNEKVANPLFPSQQVQQPEPQNGNNVVPLFQSAQQPAPQSRGEYPYAA